MGNIFLTIKVNLRFYSTTEQKIAVRILEAPEHVITCSISGLAEELGVSQGSINNFCKKVMGGGFAALKLQLAQQLSFYENEKRSFETVTDNDGARDVLRKTIDQVSLAFENTFAVNSEEVIERAAGRILRARKIEIYGIFLSRIVAENLRFQLMQLGFSVDFVSDVLLCQVSASMLDSEGLVIAISASGTTKDIIDAVMLAKENGVPVIALTENAGSPLAQVADDVLTSAGSGTNVSNSMYEAQFSQFLLADALCAYLRHRIDRDGTNQYFKVKDLLESHRIEG